MNKTQAVIDLPEDIYTTLSANGFTKEVISRESLKLLAMELYRKRVLSLDKAVELSGLSKWEFVETLSKNGIPVIAHDEINLKRENDAIDSLGKGLRK